MVWRSRSKYLVYLLYSGDENSLKMLENEEKPFSFINFCLSVGVHVRKWTHRLLFLYVWIVSVCSGKGLAGGTWKVSLWAGRNRAGMLDFCYSYIKTLLIPQKNPITYFKIYPAVHTHQWLMRDPQLKDIYMVH